MTARVTGVDHVMFGVSDLERSIEFYSQFGFTPTFRVDVAGAAVEKGSGMRDPRGRMVLLVDSGGFRLEFVQADPPVGDIVAGTHPMAVGAHHLCLTVEDLPALYRQLSEGGVRFLGEPSEFEDYPMRFVYLADPDGNVIELSESLTPAATS